MDRGGTRSERLRFESLARPSVTFAVQEIFAEAPELLFGGIRQPKVDHQTLLRWFNDVVTSATRLALGPSANPDDIQPVSLWAGNREYASHLSSVWRTGANRIRAETEIAFWKQYLCLLEKPSTEREEHNWGAVIPMFLVVPLETARIGYLGKALAIIAGPYSITNCEDVRGWFRAAKRREPLRSR